MRTLKWYWDVSLGKKPMTKALALRIKKLRVTKEYSWRAVARAIIPASDGNQILGMDLCRKAMEFLNEDEKKDGWN